MRVLIFFFFLTISFETLYAQVIRSSNRKANKLFESGMKLKKNRDFPGAIEKYKEAIKRDSSFAEAYLQAGSAYITLLQYEDAVYFYKQLVERFPDAPRYKGAHFRMAEHYFSRGQYNMSLVHAEKFLSSIDEDNPNFLRALKVKENSKFALDRTKDPLNFNPKPLEPPINEFQQQYFPVLTADQKKLFFIKREESEEIYYSERDGNDWSVPAPIDSTLTSEYNEGTCSVSADGRTMVFTSCMRKDGFGSCDLYISFKTGDKWSTPKNIGRPINSSAWDSQPALSADGKTLYYVSNRKGGEGKRDIWVSYLKEQGWTNPKNLGPSINTPGDDISPFIHVNNQTLYFASDSRLGFGGFDIYYSELNPEGNWSEPLNFGYPINTHFDQLAMFITADGRNGYYSFETRKDNQLNSKIYKIDIPPQISVRYRSSYVSGVIYDSLTKEPLQARIQLYNLTEDRMVTKVESDQLNGEYLIVLTEGAEYALYVEAENYLFNSYNFNLSERKLGIEGKVANIGLLPLETGPKTVLNNIFFEFDSYSLSDKSKNELKYLIDFLHHYPILSIEISGHTDNQGTEDYNQKLSLERARSVYDYLSTHGIDKARMTYKGYGFSQPVADNSTSEGRAQNRRIELKIFSN